MSLYAADNLSDAFVATREFLTPLDIRRWAKLALVVLFVGTGMSLPTGGFDMSIPAEDLPDTVTEVSLPADALLVGAIVAVIAVLLALLWSVISSIMEFVLVESLRNDEVRIRRYWGRRWRQGLRLFAFRLALGIPILVLFLAWMALLLVPIFSGVGAPGWTLGLFLLGIPVLFVVALLFGAIYLFTTMFVVPIMITTDGGVLDAWRRLWPTIKAEWKEYAVYTGVVVVLTPALGLVVGLVVGVTALALLIPFVAAAIAVWLTVSLTSTVGLVVIGALVALFVLLVMAIWAFVQVPVVAYLRYYALLVLGDIEPSFDIIPGQRAAIRQEE